MSYATSKFRLIIMRTQPAGRNGNACAGIQRLCCAIATAPISRATSQSNATMESAYLTEVPGDARHDRVQCQSGQPLWYGRRCNPNSRRPRSSVGKRHRAPRSKNTDGYEAYGACVAPMVRPHRGQQSRITVWNVVIIEVLHEEPIFASTSGNDFIHTTDM
jgi:hypothetical protein